MYVSHELHDEDLASCYTCPYFDRENIHCGNPVSGGTEPPPTGSYGPTSPDDLDPDEHVFDPADGRVPPNPKCEPKPSDKGAEQREREAQERRQRTEASLSEWNVPTPKDTKCYEGWSPPPGTWMPPINDTSLFRPVAPPDGLWIDRRFYGLKRRLSSVLKDNAYQRKAPLKRAGDLDMKRLYRMRLDQTNIFRRKQELGGKDYACVIAVDLSGSMTEGMSMTGDGYYTYDDFSYYRGHANRPGGLPLRNHPNWEDASRLEVAAEMSTQVAWVMNQLRIPTTVIGYNHRVKIYIDPADPPVSPHIPRIHMIESCQAYGSCNHDLEALILMEEELKRATTPTTQPFGILLSDGLPAGCGHCMWRGQYWSNSDCEACGTQWDHIKQHYPAVAVGIGTNISSVYRGARTVHTAKELNAQLAGALAHVIHRRR